MWPLSIYPTTRFIFSVVFLTICNSCVSWLSHLLECKLLEGRSFVSFSAVSTVRSTLPRLNIFNVFYPHLLSDGATQSCTFSFFPAYHLKNCSDGHLCTKLSVYISDHFLGLREDELLDSQVWNILHLLSRFIRILFQFPFLPAMCESSHLITSPLELNMFMFKSLLIFSHWSLEVF